MKRKILLAIMALCCISCSNTAEKILCGGYTEQREPSTEEMEMFRQVTASRDTVFNPIKVSTQVVAGLNYRFYCSFNKKPKEYCNITIYKPLQGQPEITEIKLLNQ